MAVEKGKYGKKVPLGQGKLGYIWAAKDGVYNSTNPNAL